MKFSGNMDDVFRVICLFGVVSVTMARGVDN